MYINVKYLARKRFKFIFLIGFHLFFFSFSEESYLIKKILPNLKLVIGILIWRIKFLS